MYNTASYVLGVLIARASGQPLEAFFRERIFEPLGMKDSGFSVPAEKLERLATSHWTNPATGVLELFDAPPASQRSRSPAFPDGGGGLVSTVDDYLTFGRMLLKKGRHGQERVLSRPSVETMTTDQLTPALKAASVVLVPGSFDGHGWGFGMSVVTRRTDPAGPVGKFGWDGGLGTSWYSDPQEDMVTILLTQAAFTSASHPPVVVGFWTSAYQAIDD
jgi:CubicO group peptidase (beta-lactamase class C family)